MQALILPSTLAGEVKAIPSKSEAHRLLILNALSTNPAPLAIEATSADIEATRRCLAALLEPVGDDVEEVAPALLDVGESGSTLRFLLPLAGALGRECYFGCAGRLAERPLKELTDELCAHGMQVTPASGAYLARGRLSGGTFTLPGNVSSQYVSALLMAAPLLAEPTEILVSTPVESKPYIDLTISALATFGVTVATDKVCEGDKTWWRLRVEPGPLVAPETLRVSGDWSGAAFWLAAGSLSDGGVTVTGLDPTSAQGDRQVLGALAAFGARVERSRSQVRTTADDLRPLTLCVQDIPDLVMPLAVVAAYACGTTAFTGAARLRLKESDRLASVCAAITALGGKGSFGEDVLVIDGTGSLAGGVVDAAGDHRIAMMAAVAAAFAQGPSQIMGAECVEKSYPGFWEDFQALGGIVALRDEEG